MSRLLTIQEHNDIILSTTGSKTMTGVACPRCETELQFKEPGVMLLSYPPKADVICIKCEYQTRIYV
jgi:hypothetical protein